MSQDRLFVFDTTLRDGEQSPGASMTREEKIRIGKALDRMRVDIIEAGFPAASKGDFEAVRAVAASCEYSTVAGLARAKESDVDRAGAAVADAPASRVHTFIGTSPIHMQAKLQMAPEAVHDAAIAAVQRARQWTDDVEFSCEDAGRSEADFLCRMIESAIDAGAGTINIPDTVGYNVPTQYGELIRSLRERIPNADRAVWSVHCHDDLGMAVANSLAGVLGGARQVECTINGLGERAGNASLEEIVMAVRTRQDVFLCDTNIETTELLPTSRLVANVTGFHVQPNKAIVGANAFAHEAGIHQDGVLKARETYEIMKAEDVGWAKNRMVLGKHSGRNAFRAKLEELGINFDTEAELDDVFARFKDLADKKHEIYDEDLQALVTEAITQEVNEHYQLDRVRVCCETDVTPEAEVAMTVNGEPESAKASGDGPVDAAFSAIEAIVDSGAELRLYSVNSITGGTDAQGEVTVRLMQGDRIVNGQAADTDIVVASAKAYVNALNKLHQSEFREHPQIAAADL